MSATHAAESRGYPIRGRASERAPRVPRQSFSELELAAGLAALATVIACVLYSLGPLI